MAPTPEAVRLAKRLRDLRDSHRLTQAELAKAFRQRSKVSVAAISSWESETKTKVPAEERLHAYALFFSQTDAAIGTGHLPAEQDLTPTDRERFDSLRGELVSLRDATTGRVGSQISTTSIWTFETGPIMIICPEVPADSRSPLAKEGNPNYTRTYRFADLDALIDLWGHIRASNPDLPIERKLSTEVAKTTSEDLYGHLVVLGGIGWNHWVRTMLADLPIEQVEVPDLENGEIFRSSEPDGREFRPRWDKAEGVEPEATDEDQIAAEQTQDAWRDGTYHVLNEDVALLARLPNPYNPDRTVTICNGVYSRGVLGAVRALIDTAVRERNEEYIARRFPSGSFVLLVRVRVVNGEAISPNLQIAEDRLYEWSPDDDAVE